MEFKQEMQEDSQHIDTSNNSVQLPGVIKQLEKFTLLFNNVLHKTSSVLLFLLMFLTVGDVLGRFMFNNPITGTYELTGLALAVIIFFSLGATQIGKGHIEIDFLTQKFSRKAQHILDTIIAFILFILMILITWQLFEYAMRTLTSNELSGDLGISLYIFVMLTMLGACSFTFTFLLDFFLSFIKVVKRSES